MQHPPALAPFAEVFPDVPLLGNASDSYFFPTGSLPRHLRSLSGFQSAASPREPSGSFSFSLDADLRPPKCCHSEMLPCANSLRAAGKRPLSAQCAQARPRPRREWASRAGTVPELKLSMRDGWCASRLTGRPV